MLTRNLNKFMYTK